MKLGQRSTCAHGRVYCLFKWYSAEAVQRSCRWVYSEEETMGEEGWPDVLPCKEDAL